MSTRQIIHLEHLDTGLVVNLSIPAVSSDAVAVTIEDSLRCTAIDWYVTTWTEPADPRSAVEAPSTAPTSTDAPGVSRRRGFSVETPEASR